MILDQCPHCGTRYVQTAQQWNGARRVRDKTEGSWDVVLCQNPDCRRLVLVEYRDDGIIERIYPAGKYELTEVINISKEVRDEFREAGIALSAGCYKASMVMSRRVLQRCLKEHGCEQRNLVNAIDYAIENKILRSQFHALANEIREYGNLSAHPDDDQLKHANRESAEKILEFTRLLIHDFYEVPAAATQLRSQRETTDENNEGDG